MGVVGVLSYLKKRPYPFLRYYRPYRLLRGYLSRTYLHLWLVAGHDLLYLLALRSKRRYNRLSLRQ